jgi:rhodanese-related sulfurtransferase
MSILSRFTGPTLPSVDATTAHERPRGVLLVDVREPSEWTGGHAPAAYHQPLGRLDPARLPRADAYYVICRSGNRSARATKALIDAGLDAHNVHGGMNAWTHAGLPVVTGA